MKKQLLLLGFAAAGLLATAAPVSQQQALLKAKAFLAKQDAQAVISQQDVLSASQKFASVPNQLQPAYYVFNVTGNRGYVIASGSDLVRPVLAYVDNGSFDKNTIPPAMQEYLEMYADQIAWAEQNNIQAAPAKQMEKHDVDVLMTTKWNQTSPYQQYLNIRSEYIWSPTGCLTTATAQVMNYHKWPAGTTKTIPSYNITTAISTPELEPYDFEWDLMKDSYSSSDRDTPEGQAVAMLMKYVALAEQASLGMTSTSTVDSHAAYALKVYFDYDDGVRFLQDWNLTTAEWDSIIYNEVAHNRPVIHTGTRFNSTASAGHAFVCDGYRSEDGLYHFNWGWGGSSDGWFALDALQPSSTGTGGGTGTGGYNYLRSITVGVQPPDGVPADEVNEVVDQLCMNLESDKVMYRDSRDEDFGEMRVGVVMYPFDFQNLWYECSLGLFNENGEMVRVYPFETKNYMKGYTYVNLFSIHIGADLPLGKYELKTVSRLLDSDVYNVAIGAEHRRMRLEVKDTELVITPAYDLTVSNVETENVSTYSSYYKINFDLTNNSDEDFVGRLYFVNNASSLLWSYGVNVPAGETIHCDHYRAASFDLKNVSICFDSRRRWSLWNGNDEWANVDYQLAFDHKANSEGVMTGNDYEFTVHLTNRGEILYERELTAVLYENGTSVNDGITQTVTAVVEPKNNKKFSFKFADLPEGKTYCLRVTHYEGTTNTNVTYGTATDGYLFTTGHGTFIQTTDGDSVVIDGNAVTIPDNALYVDMRNSELFNEVIPGNNPNTLYVLPAGAGVPDNLMGCNVVIGDQAENITLVDGQEFVTPVDFTAQNVTYKRTFVNNSDGSENYETIMLPFAVEAVTANGNAVEWAKSTTDTDNAMWVMEIIDEPTGEILDLYYAQTMEAYKPYLIAVRDLAGEELTFTGTNARFVAGKRGVASNGNYDLIGYTAMQYPRYVYLFNEPSNAQYTGNEESNTFTLFTGDVTVAPWRAYVVNYSQATPFGQLMLNIPKSEQTSVTTIVIDQKPVDTGVYTIDGRKIANDSKSLETLPAGIYIVNGQKYVRL